MSKCILPPKIFPHFFRIPQNRWGSIIGRSTTTVTHYRSCTSLLRKSGEKCKTMPLHKRKNYWLTQTDICPQEKPILHESLFRCTALLHPVWVDDVAGLTMQCMIWVPYYIKMFSMLHLCQSQSTRWSETRHDSFTILQYIIELSPCESKNYALIIMDKMSNWNQEAIAVLNHLQRNHFSDLAVLKKYKCDNIYHFVNEVSLSRGCENVEAIHYSSSQEQSTAV